MLVEVRQQNCPEKVPRADSKNDRLWEKKTADRAVALVGGFSMFQISRN